MKGKFSSMSPVQYRIHAIKIV
ncbi:hypothetical protein ACW4EZ_12905 [Bacillus toyonensis]